MKVLFYQGALYPNGAIKSTLKIAGDLSVNGINIFLATGYVLEGLEGEISESIQLEKFNKRARWHLFYLIRYIIKVKPDVIISSIPSNSMIVLLAVKMSFQKVKFIFVERTSPTVEVLFHKSLLNKMHGLFRKIIYAKSNKIIAISKGVKSEIIHGFNVSPDKVEVIYNPAVTSYKIRKSYETINEPWLTSSDAPVIVGVGRLVKQKDFSTLIKAFSVLRKKRLCKLLIVGEGEERRSLTNLIKELDIEDDVKLIGFVENPHPYMRLADLFVLSSAWEGFGNVLVEAMSYGTPVISTNCFSGPDEILKGGEIGALIEVGDINGMASEMEYALDVPQDKAVLVDRASYFSEQRSEKKYIELLRNI